MPFVANNVPAVYEKIKNDPLSFPSDITISTDSRDLIEKMLEKDPSKRITLPQIKVIQYVDSINRIPDLIKMKIEN